MGASLFGAFLPIVGGIKDPRRREPARWACTLLGHNVSASLFLVIFYIVHFALPLSAINPYSPILADKFVFPRAIVPPVLQYISMQYFHYSWPLPVAFLIYSLCFIAFAASMLKHMNALGEKHGFLDGQFSRDGVPDIRLTSTAVSSVIDFKITTLNNFPRYGTMA